MTKRIVEGGLLCLLMSGVAYAFPLTDLNEGVLGTDYATGEAFLLYSPEDLDTRFDARATNHGDQAKHFAIVKWDQGADQWQYDTNSSHVAFAPQKTDVLMAGLALDDPESATLFAGVREEYNGIRKGYADGDLTVIPDQWEGESNDGEFGLAGSFLILHEPAWWHDLGVIDGNLAENNRGPANIGQAKHMAKSALDAVRQALPGLPAVADAIESDLVGPGGIIPSWDPPADQAARDANHAPLLVGQLKAVAAPFYDQLHAASPHWLEAQRLASGTDHFGTHFPWTPDPADDNHHGMVNLGQLKAVFALRLDTLATYDHDGDGLPDWWEIEHGLDPGDDGSANPDNGPSGDPDGDGLTNAGEFQHGADPRDSDTDGDGLSDGAEISTYLTDPSDPDTDGDGMEDGYENWHGFSPLSLELGTNKAPTADFDGDGLSNKEEHDLGRLASLSHESFDPLDFIFTHELRWFGRADFWYTVEFSTDLSNWQPFPYGFIGNNNELVVDIDQWLGGLPEPSAFFRLRYGLADSDADGDGLSNADELAIGSKPLEWDTSGDGIPDGWAAVHGLDPLVDNASGLFQGGPLSNLEAYQAGVLADPDATLADHDGDGVPNELDAVADDGEINWHRTPETSYVWIEQIDETETSNVPVAVNAAGQILFNNLFPSWAPPADEALWNSATREWVGLPAAGSREIEIDGETVVFQDPVYAFIDLNDDGTVFGTSIGEYYDPVDPLIPGMFWKRNGPSLTQYEAPIYFFPAHPIVPGHSVVSDSRSGGLVHGAIANDGTINARAFHGPFGSSTDEWLIYDTAAAGFAMSGVRPLSADVVTAETFPGAILDKDRALFVETLEPTPGTKQHRIWLKEGSGQTDVSFMADDQPDVAEMALAPGLKDDEGERLWITTGGTVSLERRGGGTGPDRWHRPPSMNQGAIRLNSIGTAITADKVWRNGQYIDLDELTSKPETVTEIEAIDLASNGIILARADDDGVVGTGLLLPVEFVPDWNRDGMINDEDSGKATDEEPFMFWVNDDDDDNSEPELADVPGQGVDNADDLVNGERDLIDLFPVQLRIEKLLEVLPPGEFTYRISHPTGALNFIEMPSVQPDSQRITGAGSYLADESVAVEALTRPLNDTAGDGTELTAEYLDAVGNGMGVLLFESKAATDESFELVVSKNGGEEVARISRALPMEIDDVEKMYWRANVRPAAYGQQVPAVVPPAWEEFKDSRKDRWFVFCHGYNVSENRAGGWNAEIFKRMHQMGSDAKFLGVTWEGNQGQTDEKIPLLGGQTADYWHNVYNAFQSSDDLAERVNALPGSKVVSAHSLGNMVMSSAICDHGLQADKYFLLNAAVGREAYSPVHLATDRDKVRSPEWDGQPTRLWSSDWWRLFPVGDGRRGLSWTGRFGTLAAATDPHNYYSSGEDVLQAGDGSEPNALWDIGIRKRLHWIKAEMGKGKFEKLLLSGIHQSNAGWAFSDHWGGTPPATDPPLIAEPYFKKFSSFLGQNGQPVSVHGAQGSAVAADPLIRAFLLAHDVPAISQPTGSDDVSFADGPIDPDKNTDMPDDLRSGAWGDWEHSDLKNEPMGRVWKLFSDMVSRGELNEHFTPPPIL